MSLGDWFATVSIIMTIGFTISGGVCLCMAIYRWLWGPDPIGEAMKGRRE